MAGMPQPAPPQGMPGAPPPQSAYNPAMGGLPPSAPPLGVQAPGYSGPAFSTTPGMPEPAPPPGVGQPGVAPSDGSVVSAPPRASPVIEGKFQQSLFAECCTFSNVCLLGCFCPCILFGQMATIEDQGRTPCVAACSVYTLLYSLLLFQCPYSACYRTKLRDRFAIPGTTCGDHCTHCCCEFCAICQEYKEYQARGYRPELGWEANQPVFTELMKTQEARIAAGQMPGKQAPVQPTMQR